MVRRLRSALSSKIDLSGRDEQANTEVAAILGDLPEDHPARVAFAEGKTTAALTFLVADRPDLVEKLKATILARSGRACPP
jgi:hypothetical protein